MQKYIPIPYTSIVSQTAAIFRELFGDAVLDHHSAIGDEKTDPKGREGKDKRCLAMEDCAAPLVVSTNGQLFESLFAACPSRCRKLHNIAGSVIALDEAQSLPRKLLTPALRMIDMFCTHCGCSVVRCTATQSAFDSRQLRRGGLPLEGRELAPDPEELARRLCRARIVQGGETDDTAPIEALRDTPQGMIIVNSCAHALELFNEARAAGLDGLVHLTTRQYPMHRRAILEDICARLKSGSPCRPIATSLIKAGVPCLRASHSPSPRNLISALSTSRFGGPGARRCVICTSMAFCLRLRVEKSGTAQSRPAIDRILATIPVVCRSGRPNRTVTVKQNRIAASLNTGGRPLRPAFGASQTRFLPNHISRLC